MIKEALSVVLLIFFGDNSDILDRNDLMRVAVPWCDSGKTEVSSSGSFEKNP